jgi:ElaA protein
MLEASRAGRARLTEIWIGTAASSDDAKNLDVSRSLHPIRNITWQWCALHELTAPQWYAVMSARVAVFVVEQTCAYQELDGWDSRATHLIGWDDREVAAYLRCFAPGVKYAEASLGRILTTPAYRASGLGREIVGRGLAYIQTHHSNAPVRIGAQARLERFYVSLGFAVASQRYLEDGIAHIEMVRPGGP